MQKYNPNDYENFRNGVKDDIKGLVVNYVVSPLVLFSGVLTLAILVLIAFGKVDYWGDTGRISVGIGVPLVVILCLVNKRFGNFIFMVWAFILYVILIGLPLLGIIYVGVKPVAEYLGLI